MDFGGLGLVLFLLGILGIRWIVQWIFRHFAWRAAGKMIDSYPAPNWPTDPETPGVVGLKIVAPDTWGKRQSCRFRFEFRRHPESSDQEPKIVIIWVKMDFGKSTMRFRSDVSETERALIEDAIYRFLSEASRGASP